MCAVQCACRGQRTTSGVGPHLLPCLRQSLLLFACLWQANWPRRAWGLFCLQLSSPCRILELQMPTGSEGPNSGHDTCIESTLSIEPFPQRHSEKFQADPYIDITLISYNIYNTHKAFTNTYACTHMQAHTCKHTHTFTQRVIHVKIHSQLQIQSGSPTKSPDK